MRETSVKCATIPGTIPKAKVVATVMASAVDRDTGTFISDVWELCGSSTHIFVAIRP